MKVEVTEDELARIRAFIAARRTLHEIGKEWRKDKTNEANTDAYIEAEGRVVVAEQQMGAMWREKLWGIVRSLDKESPQIDLFADYEMHANDGDEE